MCRKVWSFGRSECSRVKRDYQNVSHKKWSVFSGEVKSPVLTDEHIRALKILTFSDNRDLQRSAALCYSEVSEKSK